MHAEPRGYLLPLGPVIKHTGPISGPLPLYARVAGTRLHACNQIPERDWKKKVGDTVTTWVSGPHAIPCIPFGVVAHKGTVSMSTAFTICRKTLEIRTFVLPQC